MADDIDGADCDVFRAGAGVPGAPQVVGVAGDVGAVPRAHQFLGGVRLPLAPV